jgi:hypothetical protein
MPQPRLALAHVPTPLWRHDALDALIGTAVWVKRDDMTAGAAAGMPAPGAASGSPHSSQNAEPSGF